MWFVVCIEKILVKVSDDYFDSCSIKDNFPMENISLWGESFERRCRVC